MMGLAIGETTSTWLSSGALKRSRFGLLAGILFPLVHLPLELLSFLLVHEGKAG